jgi:3-deoxy-D-manno-octulosonic-acid transferase
VAAQTETYARQFLELGCAPDAVRVTGNIKFDAVRPAGGKLTDVQGLLHQIGVPADAQVLVAGSTHDGEEELLARICAGLRKQFPRLFLIVVPRHFERAHEALRSVEKHLKPILRTEISADKQHAAWNIECLVVNTTGELLAFYQYATLAFVGKSMAARGGQNPIEPAALAVPAVFGPHMQNFADVARILTSGGGAIQVRSATELQQEIARLLSDDVWRQQVGRRALATVRENQGTVARTLDLILPRLARRGFYLPPESSASKEFVPEPPANMRAGS